MRILNRHIMYKRFLEGGITETEYKTYLVELEEREKQSSEKFQETVNKINIEE